MTLNNSLYYYYYFDEVFKNHDYEIGRFSNFHDKK